MTAGDWIKLRDDMPQCVEVRRLARKLGADRYSVVGRVVELWTWADRHTEDGNLQGFELADVDDLVGLDNFGQALIEVGWLEDRGGELWLPGFDRHMGQSAKKRAMDAERAARHRARKADSGPEHDASVTNVTQDRDNRVTQRKRKRKRERREEGAPGAPPPRERARAILEEEGPQRLDASPPRPPDPSLDPLTWSFASEPKDASWADWVEHLRQQDRPPTEKTLSRHWHKLRDLADAQAEAVVSAAIELGARAFTDEITRRALASVADAPLRAAGRDPSRERIAAEASAWDIPPELGGEDFRSAWDTWVKHATGHARPPTQAQLRAHLASLASDAGGQHGARRAVEYAVGQGLTGFTEGVLRIAREGGVDKATGRVIPGPGSPVTEEERRIMGWE